MSTAVALRQNFVAANDPPLRGTKVAIVGYAESSRYDVPWDDPDFEVWGLNMAHGWMPRWDRLFELHDRSTLELETEEMKREVDHFGALRAEQHRTIYMLKREADVPCSVPYPIESVKSLVERQCAKLQKQPYFTSTPAYMLALAIEKGAQEIHCYGIDLLHDDEYAYQRANFEFLCGLAIGRGIHLHIPENSAVLSADGLYGYDNAESLALLARLQARYAIKLKKIAGMKTDAATKREAAKAEYNTFDGAEQMLKELSGQLTILMRGGKV